MRGVVGSGKSLILLYRARYLSEVNPAWQMLVLTFNKSLGHYLRQKARYLGVRYESIQITHFHAWAKGLLQEANLWPAQIVQGIRQTNLLRKAQQSISGAKAFEVEFLREEIQWLKGHRVLTWEAYRDIARSGRGTALNTDQRAIVFRCFEAYQRELERLGCAGYTFHPGPICRV